jgi:hypothetical protein
VTLRPSRAAGVDTVAVLGTFLLLGVVCGVLWWLLADPAAFTKTADGVEMSEVELIRRFDVDGWYAVIAAVAGALAGLAVTWWRPRDYALTTALVVLGSVVAAGAMAVVGRVLGPADPEQVLSSTPLGARVPTQLVVTVDAAYLLWPITVLIGALMVLWSTPRVGEQQLAEDLAPHEPRPESDKGDDPFRQRAPR